MSSNSKSDLGKLRDIVVFDGGFFNNLNGRHAIRNRFHRLQESLFDRGRLFAQRGMLVEFFEVSVFAFIPEKGAFRSVERLRTASIEEAQALWDADHISPRRAIRGQVSEEALPFLRTIDESVSFSVGRLEGVYDPTESDAAQEKVNEFNSVALCVVSSNPGSMAFTFRQSRGAQLKGVIGPSDKLNSDGVSAAPAEITFSPLPRTMEMPF